jgi:MFS transporter, DHA2 family, multidrug resistance protein
LIGAAAFAVASVLAAFANSATMLIAARAVLGVAGATLAPSTLALIRNMFHDEHERTTAIALWGTSFAAGSALGPVVGGVLLEHFWWGAVFLVPVPVMGLLLLIGPRLLPEFRDPQPGRVDLASAALSLGAVLSMIYGLKLVAQDGPGATPLVCIVVGFVLGAVFLRRQRHLTYPLIDLRLFREPVFSATLVMFSLNAFVMFASSFFNAQYLQLVLGLSPLQAGLWTLTGAISVTASSMLTPVLAGRAPRAVLMAMCLVVCAVGFGVLALVGIGGLPWLVAGGVLLGLGAGPLGTLASDAIVSSAPPERAGSAASMSETSVEFGGALGIALMGSIGVVIYRLAMGGVDLPGLTSGAAQVARGTLGGALAVSHELSPSDGALLLEAARGAFAQSYVVMAIIGGVLMVAAAVMMGTVAARDRMKMRSTEVIVPVLVP